MPSRQASAGSFADVDTWIFDLDNTLYPAECHLFAQIDQRMTEFIDLELQCGTERARFLQKDWYARHGTTLAGLMIEHGTSATSFLDYVHDIDLAPVTPNPALGAALSALPGRCLIFTNGSVAHAERVAGKLGILDRFDGIFDIASADFSPKPQPQGYEIFRRRFGIEASRSAFFEDMPANLLVPFEAGMCTVLVATEAAWFADEPVDKRPAGPDAQFAHVHHVTTDLTRFLQELRRPPLST